MVFKEFGKDIINLSKNYKTLNVVTSEQVNSLGLLTNKLNSLKDIGNLTTDSMNGLYKSVQSFGNDNLTYYFQSVAEGAENARVNIVDAYAAILDGNTHGLQNVQSIMNTFNNSFDGSVEKQKEFTKAVGQSNKGLANYLNSIEAGGTATLKGYVGQLVKTTAQTVLLTAKTIALQAAISIGLSVAINGIIVLTNKLVNREKELIEKAKESSEKNDEQAKSLDELKEKYKEICDSADDEKTKNEKLNEIKQELIDVYGFEKDALKELNDERERGLGLLDGEFEKKNRNARNNWLDDNKDIIKKANEEMASDGVDYFTTYLSKNNIASSILELFDKQEAFGDTGYVNLEFDYTDTVDRLNKLKDIYNEILDIQSKRSLTADEQQLLSDVKTTLDAIQGVYDEYYDTYSKAAKYNVENIVENYLNTDEGKIENVGKDTFNSWSKGLLDQAKNAEQKRQLENYIEEAFPDLTKYFENLAKARQKFAQPLSANQYEVAWAKEKDAFLESLSPEDLEAALNIPDLFAEGLEGATKKIEEWNKNNPISPDVSIDETELSEVIETTSKKVKLITTAMEEMNDTGSISSSTYAEIVEMGGNFADCLEVQNGKLKLNVDKLKDLETQEYKNAISANELAIAQKSLGISSQYDYNEWLKFKKQLEEENAVYQTFIDEIYNAKPNESGSGSGSSSSDDPWKEQFDKEYSEKQHLLTMEQLSEEDYLNWLDDAYKKYFSDLTKYQDEYYKYEEEVYKGRKQLAEDYYNDRITDLESQIEIATKYSTDKDGNSLNTQEKFDYIRSTYQEILSEIDRRRNEIIQAGLEGNGDILKELEQQYEKYVKEMADIFKDEVESEIDYIQDLQDTVEQVYDDKIDKIEAEKKAMEDRYDAEINKIDSVIDSIESKNKSEKLTNDLIKARQDLEKANRNKRLVFDSMGNQSYVADTQAVSEAQQAVKEAEQAITVNKLEEVKKAIEDEKTVLSQSYDNQLTELKEQKEQQKTFYDDLIKTLQDYLNPSKQTESNTNVWNTVAGEDGAVKVGNSEMSTSYIDSRISSEDAVKNIYKKMLKNSAWSDTDIDKALKDYDITKLLTALTNNNYKALGVNDVLAGSSVTNAQSYVNNNRNVTLNVTNDITISGNETDGRKIANEIIQEMTKQLPNAFTQQMYRNN